MTLEEAKANVYRPVTAADNESRYNGKIQEVKDGYVRVNFGNGNLEPSCWYLPDNLSFGWTGEEFKQTMPIAEKAEPDLSAYIGYNLNDFVLVKLHDRAFEIWKRFDDAVLDFATDKIREKYLHPLDHYKARVDADGYVIMQFNELMKVFGDYCRPGYEVFDMDILLYKNKIKSCERNPKPDLRPRTNSDRPEQG